MRMNILKNNRGISIVESLVAAGIIAISILGLGVGFKKVQHSREAVIAVSSALEFESALQSALQDGTQYATIQTALKNGATTIPTSLRFQVRVPRESGPARVVNVPINTDVFFNKDGDDCGNCANWVFKTRVEGRRKGGTALPVYAMAYRVEFNQVQVALTSLGDSDATFAAEDFKWMVPLEAYAANGIESCDPNDARKAVVTGINPETKKVACLKLGDGTACSQDQIGVGWTVANGSDPIIKMECQNVRASRNCPSMGPGFDWAVNRFNPQTAKTDLQGRCVFVAQASQAVSISATAPSRSADFNVCPQHYNFQPAAGTSSGCEVTINQTHLGWRNLGCPAGYTGENWVRDVVPASLTVTGSTLGGGQRVRCTLSNDQQILAGTNNWAGYSATLRVRGTCVLGQSEFRDL